MAKHMDPAAKQAALADVKNGMKVSEASDKRGVTETTMYTWLREQADNTRTSALELAKLRRVFRLVKPEDLGRPETRVENVLKAICPIAPAVVWAGDFTYL